MMRAVRFHDYNGLSGVRIDQIPTPSVDPGALLVRVHAAGVNPFDRYAVEGYVNAFVSFTLPAVLGRDFSGVVEAVGAEVTGFMVGDAVFGQAAADAEGTFADYVSIPVDRAAKKPETISHIDAASLPNVLMAAWDGLFSTARGLDLQPGQTILINGAAGGIGGVATQLARWRGARVIGTASAGKLDLVRDLGAEPRDYAASALQLRDAVLINPYSAEEIADAIERALSMPLAERKARWRKLMDSVEREDVKIGRAHV